MNKLLYILWLLALPVVVLAQELPRKGSLGVVIQPTEDQAGIYVQQVIKGGTGAAIGLLDGDIILEVNGAPYHVVSDLINLTRNWHSGEKLNMMVLREGQRTPLQGAVLGKPLETSAFGEVIYGSVNYDGGQLRSILEIPHGSKNPPVVFYLPGIGCGSLDYYYNPGFPTKQFVEGLVSNGIAVYRVEKPGMGDSQNTQHCLEMDYQYEVEAFAAALQHLKTLPVIDPERIFLYGHSLGGMTAPLLGARYPVKGIIVWGSVSTSWYEYSLRQLRDQPVHRGEDFLTIEADFRAQQSFVYDFLVKKMTPEQLAAIPEYRDILPNYFPNGDHLYYGLHHYEFVQQLNDTNFPEAWKKAKTDVLALYGEHDFHAIDARWAEHTAAMVNYYYPGKGSWMVIPKTEHSFSKVPSMLENARMRANGTLNDQYMAENFNSEVVEVVGSWIYKILEL